MINQSYSIRSSLDNITSRENQIMILIAHDISTYEIAKKLFLSYNIVQAYRKDLLIKLNVHKSKELQRVI